MPNLLTVLAGRLGGLRRPSSKTQLALKDIRDDGTIVVRDGSLRAVLRLPTEGLDGGQQTVYALTRLGAAINAVAGRATLLAWGRPNSLGSWLQERQYRVEAHPPGSGRHDLAVSQHANLAQMAQGRPATEDRPARPPVRRTGFYLVVEERTPEALERLVETVVARFGAVRCRGAEAATLEADAWRGLPLPPRGLQIWSDASDRPRTEFYLNRDGARIRQVDDKTGAKEAEFVPV